jgi:hypothetical protein
MALPGRKSVKAMFLKISVDGVSNPLIMRPTSDAVETQNSLRINELNDSGGIGRASIF